MHHAAVAVVAVLVLGLATACSSDGGTPGQPADPEGQSADVAGEESVVITPEAELQGSCEPLPKRDDDGHHVTADLVVRNTGNVGVVVRVIANWRQPGGQRLTTSQRLRLEVEESQPVRLRIDIQPSEARAIRRMVRRDRPCYTRVHIAGAFGEPRR